MWFGLTTRMAFYFYVWEKKYYAEDLYKFAIRYLNSFVIRVFPIFIYLYICIRHLMQVVLKKLWGYSIANKLKLDDDNDIILNGLFIVSFFSHLPNAATSVYVYIFIYRGSFVQPKVGS